MQNLIHIFNNWPKTCNNFAVNTFMTFWSDSVQGNMQRCKLVMDQVAEARDTMMKVLDHKERVLKLLNKNGTPKKSSKLKRKERA